MEQKYEMGLSVDKSYVHVRNFSQPLTLNLVQELATELINFGGKNSIRKYLLDIRGTTSLTSTLDKYNFAFDKTSKIGIPRDVKVALLKNDNDNSVEFLAVVMQNSGYVFKIFEEENKAVEWLNAEISN